jgi:hypothetical protein
VGSPETRVAVRVPGSAVVISVILFIPLPFVPAAILTRIGLGGTTFFPSLITRRPAVIVLPTWGRPGFTIIDLTAGGRRARAFTAVGGWTFLTIPIAVLTVTVISAVVIRSTLGIGKNSNGLATEILPVELLHSTLSILTVLVLQDTIPAAVTVYVSKSNTSSLTTEILEILPTGVPRYPRYDKAEAGRSSGPKSAVRVKGVPFRSALLSKFQDNVGTHKVLPIESVQSVLSVATIFKLNKSKASHDTNINNTAIAVEKFGDVVRASIHR